MRRKGRALRFGNCGSAHNLPRPGKWEGLASVAGDVWMLPVRSTLDSMSTLHEDMVNFSTYWHKPAAAQKGIVRLHPLRIRRRPLRAKAGAPGTGTTPSAGVLAAQWGRVSGIFQAKLAVPLLPKPAVRSLI